MKAEAEPVRLVRCLRCGTRYGMTGLGKFCPDCQGPPSVASSSAGRQGYRVLKRVHVQAAMAARVERAELRADEVMAEIRAVAFY